MRTLPVCIRRCLSNFALHPLIMAEINGANIYLRTDNVVHIGYWLVAEPPVSIISIGLPNIFCLVKRGIQQGPHSLISSRGASSKPNATGPRVDDMNGATQRDKGFARLAGQSFGSSRAKLFDGNGNAEHHVMAIKTPSKELSEGKHINPNLSVPSIRVRNNADVVTSEV